MNEEQKILEALEKLFGALDRSKIDYVVVGGAALAMHLGILQYFKEGGDIDIVFLNILDKKARNILCSPKVGFYEKGINIYYPGTPLKLDLMGDAESLDPFWSGSPVAKETVEFYGIRIKVRPARLLRSDYLRIIRATVKELGGWKHFERLTMRSDLGLFLKALTKSNLLSLNKQKLGLVKKRRK